MVWPGVDIDELAFLGLEVGLAGTLWVLFCLVQLVGNGHVHLDLDTGKVNVIIFISHDQILVAVMPEERMSLNLNELVGRCGSVTLCVVLEALKMVQLDRDDRAGLRILDLKGTVQDADLEPMVAIELRDQVTSLIAQGKLLRIAREHDLCDIDTEQLALLSLAKTIKQDVVNSAFRTTDNGLATIFIQVRRLVFHIDLLLQLQVVFAEDKNLSLERNIDVR